MASHDVILHIVDPRLLSSTASHDVASNICQALGRGVARSKRQAMTWMHKAGDKTSLACMTCCSYMVPCDLTTCFSLKRACFQRLKLNFYIPCIKIQLAPPQHGRRRRRY